MECTMNIPLDLASDSTISVFAMMPFLSSMPARCTGEKLGEVSSAKVTSARHALPLPNITYLSREASSRYLGAFIRLHPARMRRLHFA